MDKLDIGALLMLRPFGVWIASYILLQVIEREELSEVLNYIFIGVNAFATLVWGYMLFFVKNTELNPVLANLAASVFTIWIFWIFTGFYKTISNNSRGVTISLSNYKLVDKICLLFVIPVSFLMGAEMITETLICQRDMLGENNRILFKLFVGILIVIIDLIYLISTVKRFDKYVVFGNKTVEVWNKNRGKVFKYSQVEKMDNIGSNFFNRNKYKVVFMKDEEKETIYPNDSRMGIVKAELERVINEKAQQRKDVKPTNAKPSATKTQKTNAKPSATKTQKTNAKTSAAKVTNVDSEKSADMQQKTMGGTRQKSAGTQQKLMGGTQQKSASASQNSTMPKSAKTTKSTETSTTKPKSTKSTAASTTQSKSTNTKTTTNNTKSTTNNTKSTTSNTQPKSTKVTSTQPKVTSAQPKATKGKTKK